MNTQQKIRVLFAINRLVPGGAEKIFIADFNSLPRERYEPWLLTFFPEKKETFKGRIQDSSRWRCIPFISYASPLFWFRLIRFLRSRRFDAVVSTLYFSNFVMRLACLFCPGTRCIVREANVFWGGKSRRQQWLDKILRHLTDRYIAVSRIVKRSMVDAGIPDTKISVLHNGITPEWFESPDVSAAGALRKELGIPEKAVVAITVGELRAERKGIPYLLESAGKLCAKLPDIFFLLVGDGVFPVPPSCAGRVRFLGPRADARDVRRLLHASDLFVLSSVWEGFPNVLLEAMACGLPIVSTDVGGVPELVRNGKEGFLVPPADAATLADKISELAQHAEKRGLMAHTAKERAREFGWERHLRGLEDIISGNPASWPVQMP